jgi:hypothetical protein
MSTDRKIATNQANSRLSTGPRTQAGKERSSRNSWRHGLAASLENENARSADIECLAQALARASSEPNRLKLARRVAEAEHDVLRVRSARVALITLQLGARSCDPHDVGQAEDDADRNEHDRGPTVQFSDNADRACEASAILAALPQILKLDRYERRALSRRKQAIRSWLSAQD